MSIKIELFEDRKSLKKIEYLRKKFQISLVFIVKIWKIVFFRAAIKSLT